MAIPYRDPAKRLKFIREMRPSERVEICHAVEEIKKKCRQLDKPLPNPFKKSTGFTWATLFRRNQKNGKIELKDGNRGRGDEIDEKGLDRKMKRLNRSLFDKILEFDQNISESFSYSATPNSTLGYLRPQLKWLEYSCHGLFWIPACLIGLWFNTDPYRITFLFNLLIALLLDVVLVAILKASIRRKRPSCNDDKDMFCTIGPDKMSCPSGHTSRVVLLTLIFMAFCPYPYVLNPLFTMWCLATSISRVLLGRHFAGDVLIGCCLGYIEYKIMQYLWATPDTAKWYLDFFTDSHLDDL